MVNKEKHTVISRTWTNSHWYNISNIVSMSRINNIFANVVSVGVKACASVRVCVCVGGGGGRREEVK
jgi:hypothetical protein